MALSEKIDFKYKELSDLILKKAGNILLGKERELKLSLACMFLEGHLLIEDVPGVGKTTLVHLLGQLCGLSLNRIQFTNDLLPGDILGTTIFKKSTEEFEFIKGPIFGELVLADELNRATPKTQSALLECMEERLVSVEGKNYELPKPFVIVATQNPFNQLGTYRLPESQLDRFLMALYLDFPSRDFERKIYLQEDTKKLIRETAPIMGREDFEKVKKEIDKIHVDENLINYLLDILEFGRKEIPEGAFLSPRAGKDLVMAAKANAYLCGRNYANPEDIQVMAPPVLGHRLGSVMGVRKGQGLIKDLVDHVQVVR